MRKIDFQTIKSKVTWFSELESTITLRFLRTSRRNKLERSSREGVEETGGSVADFVHQVFDKRDQMKGNPSLSLSRVVGETPVNFNIEALKKAAR